ncbi:MAG: S8 family serine peptidase [Methylophilaceae bacterium]
MDWFLRKISIAILLNVAFTTPAFAATAPAEAIAQLRVGKAVNLIVEYDDSTIEQTARNLRKSSKNYEDDDAILRYKFNQYQTLKSRIDGVAMHPDIQSIRNYSHLPMNFKHFSSVAGLNKLLAQTGIKAVYLDKKYYPVLAQSLPLINQPMVASAGEQGNGTTVAVIDDTIDFTNAAFGSCTAANTPANSCRVVVANNFATSPAPGNGHGTNVAGIVLGVAPLTKIAALNVFDTAGGAFTSDIISAINWAITNKATYNIVAINMSLGDNSNNTSTCPFDATNTPINNARNAGISVVVASGNSALSGGLASPACVPNVISVGAVYDSNIGAVTWGTVPNCTDNITQADKVACFSNSANYLTILAPGAYITAAGITEAGTSQAAPHVAGAVAVLKSTFPAETITQTLNRLTSSGVAVTDTRNNITKPRLNLAAAAAPANDNFTNRISISGNSGTKTGLTQLATKEAGEPSHAGNAGGQSVWWTWTASAAGQLSLDTHGSNFDTLLGVYTGTGVNVLSQVAANDNDGAANNNSGLFLQTVANRTYQIAVDGANGAAGNVALNWSLNTTAKANLGVTISGSNSVLTGGTYTYTIIVSNAGPQVATNVVASATLPAGASFSGSASGCSASGVTITCNIGSIANGGTGSASFQVLWSSIAANASIATSVNSDVPDSVATNNNSTIAISQGVNTTQNTDVPLPPWALVLTALSLLGFSLKSRFY